MGEEAGEERRGAGEGNWPHYVFILCRCTNKQQPIKSTKLKKKKRMKTL